MLVLAAIMPAQHLLRHAGAEGSVENALEQRRLLFFVAVVRVLLEKRGRRQLLIVAGDDKLLAAIDGADRVLRENLRRFIEHDQIELQSDRPAGTG